MFVYWLFFAFFAVAALMAAPDFRRSKPITAPLLLGGLVIMLFLGLRYRTGTDWLHYYRQWEAADAVDLAEIGKLHRGDAGFYALMWSVRNFGAPFWILNVICAGVFTWGLLAFAKRLPNPWLAVAIATPYLIIVIAMSATRQSAALGFVFLALLAFIRRKTRAFLGWSAVATLFHASASLTIPFAGLSFAKTKFQAALTLIVIGVLGWFTLGSPFTAYSNRYLNDTLPSSGLLYRVAMNAIAAIIYLLALRNRVGMEDHERVLWRNYSLFAVAAIAVAALMPASTALDRLLIYLFPMQIFSLAMFPYVQRAPTFPLLVIVVYLALILFVFLNFGVNAESYIPYKAYWPEM